MDLHCDGCGMPLKIGELHGAHADGHEARYCVECHDEYTRWLGACGAEEARLNRLLDVFLEESRATLALHFVPQDLPPVRLGTGQPLVLG